MHARKANDNKAIGIMKQKLIKAIIEEDQSQRDWILGAKSEMRCNGT